MWIKVQVTIVHQRQMASTTTEQAERWAVIPGFSKYEASTLGRIRITKSSKIKKRYKNGEGYLIAPLIADESKENKNMRTHRLVLMAFSESVLPAGWQGDHKNHDRADNRLENLQVVSPRENCQNRRPPKPRQRRRINQTSLDGVVIKTWDSMKAAAEHLRMAESTIRRAIGSLTQTANGSRWSFVPCADVDGVE